MLHFQEEELKFQIASARREHALLSKQRDVAAESIEQLSDALAALSQGVIVEVVVNPPERLLYRICNALSAVIQVRLLELQMSHENFVARVDDLEAALKIADGGDLAALNRAIPRAPSEHTPEQGARDSEQPIHNAKEP